MNRDYIEELLGTVAVQVQKKYRHMAEVQQLTKELGQGLSKDDKIVTNMVLEMRGQELEEISACDACIQQLLTGASQGPRETVEKALGLRPCENECEDNVLLKRIKDTVQATKHIWQQTVEMDKALSKRLAGADSYYEKG